MFPTIAEYNKAISTQGSGVFNTLKGLSFIPSRTVPVKIFSFGAGSYAVVFKANDGFGQYAIRCFISSAEENLIRYKKISSQLRNINDSWKTSFEIIDDEILVNGRFYPVLKMEWIEGQLINNYVGQVLNNNQAILELQKEIVSTSKSLEANQVGHGDIQCGNILITKDFMGQPKVKLIDYDGMYISDFKYQSNLEKGRSEFQHPKRTQFDYNEKMDRFPFWVMITALEALKYDKSLWLEVMQGGFNTLDNFLCDDFKNPFNSKLFNRLSQINQPSLNHYLTKLKNFCLGEISEVGELELYNNITNPIENINSVNSSQSNSSFSNTIINPSSSIDLSNAEKALQIRAKLKSNSIDKISKLEILKEGFDSGLLNESEYDKLKDEILFYKELDAGNNANTNHIAVTNTVLKTNTKKGLVINYIIAIIILLVIAWVIYYLNKDKFSRDVTIETLKNERTIYDTTSSKDETTNFDDTKMTIDTNTDIGYQNINEDKANSLTNESINYNSDELPQPTKIEIIGEVDLNKLIRTSKILIYPKTKNISNYLDNDQYARTIQNKLENIFSKELPVINLENQIKSSRFDDLKCHVSIQYDYRIILNSSGNEAIMYLSVVDESTKNMIATFQFRSGRYFTSDNSHLINKLLNDILANDKINIAIHSFYEQMLNNGRKIIFDITCDGSFGSDFKSTFNGELLSDIIENWISKNTIRSRFESRVINSKTVQFTANMPISDSNGFLDMRVDGVRSLRIYLRKNYQIQSKMEFSTEGFPSLNLTSSK